MPKSHVIRATISEFGVQYDNPFREIKINSGQQYSDDPQFSVEESNDVSEIFEITIGGGWELDKVSVITSALEEIPELTILNDDMSACT